MVIFDTNILIDHLRQTEEKKSVFDRFVQDNLEETFGVSMITVQELYAGKSTRNKNEEMRTLFLLNKCTIFSYTYEIATFAGKIERDLSLSIELPDAAIAATAILNDAQLFTLNKKDFEKIPNLELYRDKNHD